MSLEYLNINAHHYHYYYQSQVSALTKFLATAQLCVEIRNYATALAIIAGLDNLLVRQLPAWKHLSAKAATLMDDLEALQVSHVWYI